MEQRPLRLGDIVDDYCPRERRLTNHAIVALVGDVIRQTRCSACDTEHVYKGGTMPKRRKKEDSAFDQVLAGVTAGQLRPRLPGDPADRLGTGRTSAPVTGSSAPSRPADPMAASAARPIRTGSKNQPTIDRRMPGRTPAVDTRDTARTDADPPPVRPIPEFTMHQRQPQGRGGGFRHGGWRNGNGNGHGFGNGFRQGRPGQGSGFSNGAPGQGRGRHRRRSGGGGKPK
jgi:hypothetical protein